MNSIQWTADVEHFAGANSVELRLETTGNQVYTSDCEVVLNPYDRRDSGCIYNGEGYVKPGDTGPAYDYSHLPHVFNLRFLQDPFTYHSLSGSLPPEWLTVGGRQFISGMQGFGDTVVKVRRSPKAKRGNTTGLYWEWEGELAAVRNISRTFSGHGSTDTLTTTQPVKLVLVEAGETIRARNPATASCGLSIYLTFQFEPFAGVALPTPPARGDVPIGSALDLALDAAGYARGTGGAYQYPTVWASDTIHKVGSLDAITAGPVFAPNVLTRFDYTAAPGGVQRTTYEIFWPTPSNPAVVAGYASLEPDAERIQNFVAGHLPGQYGVNEINPPATVPPFGEDTWVPYPTQPIHLSYVYRDPDPTTIEPVFPGSTGYKSLWFTPGGPYENNPVDMPDVTQWLDITRAVGGAKAYPTPTIAAGINIELTRAE